MSLYTPGDIVTGYYPFTDTQTNKLRPFLILSVVPENLYWAIMLSSQLRYENLEWAYLINKNEIDFTFSGTTIARTNVLMTVAEDVINKKMGRATDDLFDRIKGMVKIYFPLD